MMKSTEMSKVEKVKIPRLLANLEHPKVHEHGGIRTHDHRMSSTHTERAGVRSPTLYPG